MIAIDDTTTIADAFQRAVQAYGPNSLLAVPANPARAYDPAGREISYAQAAEAVTALAWVCFWKAAPNTCCTSWP
jgi:hypothetical protein